MLASLLGNNTSTDSLPHQHQMPCKCFHQKKTAANSTALSVSFVTRRQHSDWQTASSCLKSAQGELTRLKPAVRHSYHCVGMTLYNPQNSLQYSTRLHQSYYRQLLTWCRQTPLSQGTAPHSRSVMLLQPLAPISYTTARNRRSRLSRTRKERHRDWNYLHSSNTDIHRTSLHKLPCQYQNDNVLSY